MAFLQTISITSSLREVCNRIQENINSIQTSQELNKIFERNLESEEIQSHTFMIGLKRSVNKILDNLKSDIVRTINSQLPHIINFQERTNQKIEDLTEQLEVIKQKYKKLCQIFQQTKLEADRLKIQVVGLSEAYQNTLVQYEQMKSKFYQMKAQNQKLKIKSNLKSSRELQLGQDMTPKLNKRSKVEQIKITDQQKQSDNPLSSKSGLKSNWQYPLQQSQKTQTKQQKQSFQTPRSQLQKSRNTSFQMDNQIINCQKQLYEIEIRQSQKQIEVLKIRIKEDQQYIARVEKQNQNLERLLDGQTEKSEKVDRQLYEVLGSLQTHKIQLLEAKALERQCENKKIQIQKLYERLKSQYAQLISQKENISKNLNSELKSKQLLLQKLNKSEAQIKKISEQLKAISQKYESLKKIYLEEQQKISELKSQLQLQKDQKLKQVQKNNEFQKQIKQQNSQKIKEISQMNLQIKTKYQQKINLLQKNQKEIKQKNKHLKGQIECLYQALDQQVGKEIKLQQKTKASQAKMHLLQQQIRQISEQNQILLEKMKTQNIVLNQYKKQQKYKDKSQQQVQQKFMNLKLALPMMESQLILIKEDLKKIKNGLLSYKQLIMKICQKNLIELENFLQLQKHQNHQKQQKLIQKLKSHETLNKQNQQKLLNLQNHNIQLIKKLNDLQSQKQEQQKKFLNSQNAIQNLNKEIKNLKEKHEQIKSQNQKLKDFHQNGVKNIELMRDKYKEVEQFYKLMEDLTEENIKLRDVLKKYQSQVSKIDRKHQPSSHNHSSSLYPYPNSNSCSHLNINRNYQSISSKIQQPSQRLHHHEHQPQYKYHIHHNQNQQAFQFPSSFSKTNIKPTKPMFFSRDKTKQRFKTTNQDQINQISHRAQLQRQRLQGLKKQYSNMMVQKMAQRQRQRQQY